MLSMLRKKPRYSLVSEEQDPELKLGGEYGEGPQHVTVRMNLCTFLAVISMLLAAIGLVWTVSFSSLSALKSQSCVAPVVPSQHLTPTNNGWICRDPTTRREWRQLEAAERDNYITAVNCLASKPSKLRNAGTLYDDFPWVHKHLSARVHKAATFLPWHREFVYLYEKALKEECEFEGDIPYWDWTLDASDFRNAPIWSISHGLGGDGDVAGHPSVGDGGCVTQGPFANLTKLRYFDGDELSHCLSRGFAHDAELAELGQLVSPNSIDQLVRLEESYDHFESELERRAHNFLSRGVGGDLARFTGPNDPVFWLHHVNLDRLWAEWQAQGRLWSYGGRRDGESDVAASLADSMDFAGLGRTIPVEAVMTTVGGRYCYQY